LKIETYKHKLIYYRNNIDSLLSDSTLFVVSEDSMQFLQYLQKLVLTAKEVHPVDSMLKQSIN
ncbi:MAG TPA: hypothetical protein VK796_00890, partial [Cytophaga sp.]|nr:hypothetical protein [Cytophaga sp.]